MLLRYLIILVILVGSAGSAFSETVLTVEKCRELALEYNRQLLQAKKEVDRAQGEIISARSGALPILSLDGRYTRNVKKAEMFLPGEFFDEKGFVKIPAAQNNDFNLTLSLTQPLYVGGKVGTALKIAKIYSDFSKEKVRQVEAAIVFGAESVFFEAVLTQSQLEVMQKSHEQLCHNLEVAEKNYEQGMISEYELLRARVEKLNLEPQLLAARSNVNISGKRLKTYLGIDLDETIRLAPDMSDTSAVALPTLDSLTTLAMQNRPELYQAELEKRGYEKAIRIAQGDWLYPNLYANASYNLSASGEDFRIGERNLSKSLTVSLLLNVPLFDGGRTLGEVRKSRVDYYQAMLRQQQLEDDIHLEVEEAFDRFQQSREALTAQSETIAQAEEGMRIADLRYESGVGTQLEVLSAQTALTQARSQLAQTIFQYRLARAALKRATGWESN